ncbi:MAG: tRNA lysidine(34) synthetase TilS, partial [Bacteroidia bacterium]|nr:tRNA lysidine(34) synthetase TilS [Bacteroidia bacterium]
NIVLLKKVESINTVLYEILKPYGFDDIGQIVSVLDEQSGKQFFSNTHQLIKDRDHLIISPIRDDSLDEIIIEENQIEVEVLEKKLSMETISNENFKIPNDPKIACLDKDKLAFPLKVRKWRDGDYFCPLGMKQKKKLSDFLIDEKVPLNEKERQLVVFSNEDIVWVIGRRIDDRYRIKKETSSALLLSYK